MTELEQKNQELENDRRKAELAVSVTMVITILVIIFMIAKTIQGI